MALNEQIQNDFRAALQAVLYDEAGQLRRDRFDAIITPKRQNELDFSPVNASGEPLDPILLLDMVTAYAENHRGIFEDTLPFLNPAQTKQFQPVFEAHFAEQAEKPLWGALVRESINRDTRPTEADTVLTHPTQLQALLSHSFGQKTGWQTDARNKPGTTTPDGAADSVPRGPREK